MAKIMLLSHLLGYPVQSYKFGRLADGKRSNGMDYQSHPGKKNNELRKNMYIVLKVIMNGISPDIRV